MPLVKLGIPTVKDIGEAKKLCDKAGELLHNNLGVPDPKDKESRIVISDLETEVLRIAFTIGLNEYPDFEPKSFFPTKNQIESAGQSILTVAKESRLGVSQVIIEAWKDTTFALKEGAIPEPVSLVSGEKLKEIGSHLFNPRMKLFLSPQKQEGASFSKEFGPSAENENYKEVASKLSRRMAEIFGREELIETEIELVYGTDINFSVEFDCETEPNKLISQEVRQYMAESVLRIMDSSQSTKEGSGEVWIRQGQPKQYVFK